MRAAIAAYVGTNGGGKTLAAVEQCVLPAVAEGRVIVGNLRLAVPDFRLLRSWREIIRLGVHVDFGEPARFGPRGERLTILDPGYSDDQPLYSLTQNRPCLVMLDEITACLPSRSYSSMPTQLQRVLNQLRKQDTTLVWTAPNWARCDVLLREVTQMVTVCRGYFPDRWVRDPDAGPALVPPIALDDQGQRIPAEGAWKPRRLFRWVTYDAVDFEEFTADDQRRIRPLTTQYYWRPVHPAQFVYQTYESVQLLDHLDDLGTCLNCNGKRTQNRCTCATHDSDESSARAGAPPAAQPRGARTASTSPARRARSSWGLA
jgi:hypothetical protein